MSSGAFVGETLDATLLRAILGPTRHAGSVSLGLSTKNPVGIVLWFVGSSVFGARVDGRGRYRGGISGRNADGEQTAAPAARLTLRVELALRSGLALLLLQAAAFAKRCTNYTCPLFADAAAAVSKFLLLLLRELRLARVDPIGRVHPGAMRRLVWRSGVWRISHRGLKYRGIQKKSRVSLAEPRIRGQGNDATLNFTGMTWTGLEDFLEKVPAGAIRCSSGVHTHGFRSVRKQTRP